MDLNAPVAPTNKKEYPIMSPSHSNTYNNRNKNKVEKRIHCVSQVVEFQPIKLLFKSVRLAPCINVSIFCMYVYGLCQTW